MREKYPSTPLAARLLVLWAALAFGGSAAEAIVVMNLDPTANYAAPNDTSLPEFAGHTDPGWANITQRGVYLGNGWVLSANHTFDSSTTQDKFRDEAFDIVPNSTIRLKNTALLTNAGYTTNADLKLYRLNSQSQFDGTPEQVVSVDGSTIQRLSIGHSRMSTNKEVVVMTEGRIRSNSDLVYWTGDKTSDPTWQGQTDCIGCFNSSDPDQYAPSNRQLAVGYQISQTTSGYAWGTNKVESSSQIAQRLEDFKSAGSGYYLLDDSVDTVAQGFYFDDYEFTLDGTRTPTSGGGNEMQAAAGDSGGGIFSWNGSSWELNGTMLAVANYIHSGYAKAIHQDNGSGDDIVYGDLNVFADLSYYSSQIEAYISAPEGYEWAGTGDDTRFFSLVNREYGYDSTGNLVQLSAGVWGDINLDGVVSGDGTGSWEDDDVTAFAQGWGWEQASGDMFSWKRGDLNQDGVTDWSDFALLRQGIAETTGAQLSFAAVVGGSGVTVVPEPGSAALLAGLASLGFGWCWRKRQKPSVQ
ncbi:PEP-CTERM sorting domain-containing protein [Aeoliella mucimassa]|nr:PEP-CTERM sorting domain-containing protein [Aeoliella mucimassa]